MSEAPEKDDDIHPIARRLRFLESPKFGIRLTLLLGAAFLGLAGVDLFHHRHELFSWEGFPGFHVWFGFAAFTFVVLMGWPLHKLLSRPETYYDGGDGDA